MQVASCSCAHHGDGTTTRRRWLGNNSLLMDMVSLSRSLFSLVGRRNIIVLSLYGCRKYGAIVRLTFLDHALRASNKRGKILEKILLSILSFRHRHSSTSDDVLAETTRFPETTVASESAIAVTAQWQTSTPGSGLQAESLPFQSSEDGGHIALGASTLLVEYEIRRDELTAEKFRELIQNYDIAIQSFPTGTRYNSDRKIGGFGKVYQVSAGPDDCKTFHAIKVFEPRKWMDDWHIYMRILREARVWSQLKHDNILKLQGVWFDLPDDISGGFKFPALVAPWCSTGTLYEYLNNAKRNGQTFILSERLNTVIDAGNGVQYLHAKGIVHGDVGPTNVLIDGQKAILCDFGTSKWEEVVTGLTTRSHGHLRYTSPELLKDDKLKATKCSDMYSLGCLSLYAITDKEPFEIIINGETVRDKVIAGEPPDHYFSSETQIAPPACLTLLKETWNFDPSKRPQISDFMDEVHTILSQDSGGVT
ncbi:kinase-like protein [Rickenella mellea]|uniref:Kinase-like protein n=1 Tax=Rickenella mellea TaxID=50990 RepID=A0A4Y7Q6Y7_9AGAM|nr:kinase-like protein [Rickenella mellea]